MNAELDGANLDHAVALAEGLSFVMRGEQPAFESEFDPEGPAHEYDLKQFKMWLHYRPSRDWGQGGPIIERERISVTWPQAEPQPGYEWHANIAQPDESWNEYGPTPLIAAMRAYVASRVPANGTPESTQKGSAA